MQLNLETHLLFFGLRVDFIHPVSAVLDWQRHKAVSHALHSCCLQVQQQGHWGRTAYVVD